MAGVVISVAAEVMKSRFGMLQAPLRSYIVNRASIIEKEEAAFKKVFREDKSTHFAETYSYETDMDDMLPVGEGGAYPNTSFQEGYPKTIRSMVFKSQFSITREAVDDDQLGSLKTKPEKLLRAYYRTRARLMARAIGEAMQGNTSFSINGFSFDTTSADGVCLFSASHAPKVSGSNQSNLYSDAFSHANLFKAVQRMRNLKDDNGNVIGVRPNAILIPDNNAALTQEVLEVVSSMQKPGTDYNNNNVLFGNFEVITSAYLNDFTGAITAPWFLLDTDYNELNDGSIFLDRTDLEIKSDIGPNDNNLWKGYARFGVGFADFRQIMALGVTGASPM